MELMSDKKTFKKAIVHLKKKDKVLGRIIQKHGAISISWSPSNPYEAILETFISQQISGAAANSITKKFKALFNGKFPSPKKFLNTPLAKIRSAGISPQKYSYMKDLCEKISNGDLNLQQLSALPDEEVVAILDDVKGIGRWTAEMYLMFTLSRINVFALDDLGLKNAVMKAYKLKKVDKEKLTSISNKWIPYRSVAALYLWRSLDNQPPK